MEDHKHIVTLPSVSLPCLAFKEDDLGRVNSYLRINLPKLAEQYDHIKEIKVTVHYESEVYIILAKVRIVLESFAENQSTRVNDLKISIVTSEYINDNLIVDSSSQHKAILLTKDYQIDDFEDVVSKAVNQNCSGYNNEARFEKVLMRMRKLDENLFTWEKTSSELDRAGIDYIVTFPWLKERGAPEYQVRFDVKSLLQNDYETVECTVHGEKVEVIKIKVHDRLSDERMADVISAILAIHAKKITNKAS